MNKTITKKVSKKTKRNKKQVQETLLLVGIGSSAGGLVAIEKLFMNIKNDPSLAISFVIISHMDPKRHSYLVEIISNYTSMKIKEIDNEEIIQPQHIYVIPPDKTLIVKNHHFHLAARRKDIGTINNFFDSLAIEFKNKCIGIILSGTGSDGALGLQTISKNNGLTIVQDPKSSSFSSMPQSAIDTGVIDHVIKAEEISKEITSYYQYLQSGSIIENNSKKELDFLHDIYSIIKKTTGIDFTDYKSNSIIRQINRHMIQNKFKNNNLYIKFLKESDAETQTLSKLLLIGVTQFFRDPESFLFLGKHVISKILSEKKNNESIRIWVCGCSTGEEAYTLAIIFKDLLTKLNSKREIKIFATDVNETSIIFARKGNYPLSAQKDISPSHLAKYFNKQENSLQIKDEIRNMIIFATHNIATDPIFSNIDLTSCRNLLIYLDTKLQKTVIPLLIYSLNQDGHLFLGHSESLGVSSKYFKQISPKHKIFQINIKRDKQLTLIQSFNSITTGPVYKQEKGVFPTDEKSLQKIVSKIILESYSPSGVVINKDNDIIYYHGKTSAFLETNTGKVNMNIFNLIIDDLRTAIDVAVENARSHSKVITSEEVQVEKNNKTILFKVTVSPLAELDEDFEASDNHLLLVLFEKSILSKNLVSSKDLAGNSSIALKKEIKSTKIFYENKLKNLEIQSDNSLKKLDGIQTVNEELQSSNEELETSREELQAIYEELQNVVSEQETKLKTLSDASDDMSNLLASTEIGTIFLADDLKIKRFTPAVRKIVNLNSADIGRSITDFASALNYKDLGLDIKKVLKELTSSDSFITNENETTFHMRIHPYHTVDNRIDGVVLTFVDITDYEHFLQNESV